MHSVSETGDHAGFAVIVCLVFEDDQSLRVQRVSVLERLRVDDLAEL